MKALYTKPLQTNANSDTIMQDMIPNQKESSGLTGNSLVKDLVASGNKNLWTGTKSSMTYQKRHDLHHIPNFHKEFNPEQKQQLKTIVNEAYDRLFENTVYRRNVSSSTGGGNRSAVPHGLMQDRTQENKPYKPKDGKVSTWIDRMSERKKNQGLTHLQKKDTLERNLALANQKGQE